MKILILITRGDTIGGAQTHVLTLSQLLQSNGHNVLVCYGGNISGPFHDLLNRANINHLTINSLKREISFLSDLISIYKFRKIMNNYQPDAVSLHSSKAGIIGRLGAIFSKIPVIFTVHGWAFTEGVSKRKASFYKFVEQSLSRLAVKFIVVSSFDKQIAIDNQITSENKIAVIHNGIIPMHMPHTTVKEETSIVQGCMVARFDEQKDHETLIRACVGVDNIKIHLLGDGPALNAMIDLARALQVDEKFVFHGYSDKVESFLSCSDFFLLISNWEGFPISTLEAMNHSLPVVISDVGGSHEAIEEGISGFLIGRKDIAGLTLVLQKLVGNIALRQSMGKRAKERLASRFSAELMYQKTIKIFIDSKTK